MIRQFTVALAHGGLAAALHRRVLASLPAHFCIVESGNADAVLLTGLSDLHNASIVVLDGSAIISPPSSDDLKVVPALRYAPRLAADPAIGVARRADVSLIDVVTTVTDVGELPHRALIEQFAALRIMTGQRPQLLTGRRVGTGYIATAQMTGGAALVTLAGIVSPLGDDAMSLDAVGPLVRVHIAASGGLSARPAEMLRYDDAGLRQGKLVHQNSLRLTWLQAHALLGGASQKNTYPASALREDLASIRGFF